MALLLGLAAGSIPAQAQVPLPFGLEATFRPHGDQYPGVSSADFGLELAKEGDTLAVGSRGAIRVFVRTGSTWVLQQTLTDGVSGSGFGESIALSGDTLVAGAAATEIGGLGGLVHVFVRTGSAWSLQQTLAVTHPWGFSLFGTGVAVEGDTILAGAPSAPSSAGGIGAGVVHVFTRTGSVWSEQQRLETPDGAGGDRFGETIALSGDTVVIGAPFRDDAGATSGAAFVFTRSGGAWAHQQTLHGLDTAASDKFGASVGVSGDRVVVGATGNGLGDTGAAYVFTRSGTVWTEQQKLLGVFPNNGDFFGISVDVDGDDILVGTAKREAYAFAWSGSTWTREALLGTAGEPPGVEVTLDGGDAMAGAWFEEGTFPPTQGPDIVTVFTRPAATWLPQMRLYNPDLVDDSFGAAVACSGETLAVGAPRDVTGVNLTTGSVSVFSATAGAWSERAKLVAASLPSGAAFGTSVALQGTTLIAGAPGVALGVGSAFVFDGGSGTWTSTAPLVPPDGQPGDRFGEALAFQGDTAVVGAVGADPAGAAYVFVRSGGGWSFQAKLVPPDGAQNDTFGSAVGVSGDTIVVGARLADHGGATDAGAAYVFVRSGTSWAFAQKLTAFDADASAFFGESAVVSGNDVLVGAPFANGTAEADAGAVYAFARSGGIWSLTQRLAAAGGAPFDRFGAALAIDADVVAVGAFNENADPSSIEREGAVHVFGRAGGWVEVQRLAVPGSQTFGSAVALALPLTAAGGFNNHAASVFRAGPTADLAVSLAAPAEVFAGTAIHVRITVANQGVTGVTGARVTDLVGPPLANATWTCAASPGSTCTASGTASVSDIVQIAPQGLLTYDVDAVVTPDALDDIVQTASVALPPGLLDADPLDDTARATIAVTRRADVSIDKTDGRLRVAPGRPISYQLTVRNAGPSRAYVFVTDTFPAAYTGPTWTCSAQSGSLCHVLSGSGNIASMRGTLLAGHSLTFTTNGTVSAAATGVLSNTATVSAETGVDPVTADNSDSDLDLISLAAAELTPGSALLRSFAVPGPHYYWLAQQPFSSYEVVVDAASGDVGPVFGLQRLGANGSAVLQSSAGVSGIGLARSLAFRNDRSIPVDHELIRVTSGECSTDCGDDDVYRVRTYETTGRIPRFNNSGTQVSVVILQNTTDAAVSGTAYFWGPEGSLRARSDFALGARQTAVIGTAGLPDLADTSGSVTVGHNGPYGALAGKGVSLEPSTGFSFDSLLEPVRR